MLTLASSHESEHEEDDHESESDSESESEVEEEEEEDVFKTSASGSHRHSIRNATGSSNNRKFPDPVVQAPNENCSRSGSPTPRNSPRGSGRQQVDHHRVSLPPSAHSSLTRHQISQVIPNLHPRSAQQSPPTPPYEPRVVF